MKSDLKPKIQNILKESQERLELLEEKKNDLIRRIVSAADAGKIKKIREKLNTPK